MSEFSATWYLHAILQSLSLLAQAYMSGLYYSGCLHVYVYTLANLCMFKEVNLFGLSPTSTVHSLTQLSSPVPFCQLLPASVTEYAAHVYSTVMAISAPSVVAGASSPAT